MTRRLVAGVDSSTQTCKVVIRDAETGEAVRSGSAPHPDGTEVHPEAWWRALGQAVEAAGGLGDVAAVSVAAQQHGMVCLDGEGQVVRPALLWNDTRSADAAAELVGELGPAGAQAWADAVGSVPVASFTVAKLRWLAAHEPSAVERTEAVCLPHDWLTWRLTGGAVGGRLADLVTDRGDASGTGYWSPAEGTYRPDLLQLAMGKVPVVPRVAGPAEQVGCLAVDFGSVDNRPTVFDGDPASLAVDPTTGSASRTTAGSDARATPGSATRATSGSANRATAGSAASPTTRLAAGTAVGPGTGDNAAAALGLDARPGDVIVSIGTSGTVFGVAVKPAADATGSIAGFADATGRFLPLVCTLNAARVLEAAASMLGVGLDELSRLALTAPPGSDGLTVIPYLEGERTPNRPNATAAVHGWRPVTSTPAHLARAAIEGMLCGLADGLDALTGLVDVRRVLLIGGGARSEAVRRIAPAVLGVPVGVPAAGEYVADGAARQAAWVLSGGGDPPVWSNLGDPVVYEADLTPGLRSRYADFRDGG